MQERKRQERNFLHGEVDIPVGKVAFNRVINLKYDYKMNQLILLHRKVDAAITASY